MAQTRRSKGVRKASKVKASGAKPRGRRVRVVRSRATRAKKPVRPLPPAEMLSERLFLSSLERSLRDNRQVWEALAKR
jgi:hypothetical protein